MQRQQKRMHLHAADDARAPSFFHASDGGGDGDRDRRRATPFQEEEEEEADADTRPRPHGVELRRGVELERAPVGPPGQK